MINRDTNPVGWAALLYELEDAHEHLGNLIWDISADPDYAEGDLRVDLGHVYAHLNRAWFRRNVAEDFPEAEWTVATSFPVGIEPIG
jgi:hypothetical protein